MVKLLPFLTIPALAVRKRHTRSINLGMFLEPKAAADPIDRAKNMCYFVAKQLRYNTEYNTFDLDWTISDYNYTCKLRNYQGATNVEIHEFLEQAANSEICAPLIESMNEDDYRKGKKKYKQLHTVNPWDNVKSYGCYCSFGDKMISGRGDPVNLLDDACHYAHMNYECLYAESPYCKDVELDDYYIQLEQVSPRLTTTEACHLYNQELQLQNGWSDEQLECVSKRCLIDSEFINDVVRLAVNSDYSFDPYYIRPDQGGNFAHKEECPRKYGDGGYELQCCGHYPLRFTYPGIKWGCCERAGLSEAFRLEDQTCCSDGSIASFGDPEFNTCT